MPRRHHRTLTLDATRLSCVVKLRLSPLLGLGVRTQPFFVRLSVVFPSSFAQQMKNSVTVDGLITVVCKLCNLLITLSQIRLGS